MLVTTVVRNGYPRACTDARVCLIFFKRRNNSVRDVPDECSVGTKWLLAAFLWAIIPSHCTARLMFMCW